MLCMLLMGCTGTIGLNAVSAVCPHTGKCFFEPSVSVNSTWLEHWVRICFESRYWQSSGIFSVESTTPPRLVLMWVSVGGALCGEIQGWKLSKSSIKTASEFRIHLAGVQGTLLCFWPCHLCSEDNWTVLSFWIVKWLSSWLTLCTGNMKGFCQHVLALTF